MFEIKAHHLPPVLLVLSPSPDEQEQIQPEKAGQQRHPNRVVGHSEEQLDCVLNIHCPGHDEEVAAKVGQVVTETLCPQKCAPWPHLE